MKLFELDESLRTENPCWKGYHPVGTKKKNGRTVPNCVPESAETDEAANPAQQAAIAINMKKQHQKPKSESLNEGMSELITGAIEDLRSSKPGMDIESFLDDLYYYMDAEYGKRAADLISDAGETTHNEWYDLYSDLKEQGVAEGGFKNLYAEFSGYGNYMQGRAVNVFNKAGLEVIGKEYSEDDDIQTYVVKGDRWAIEKAGQFLERNPEQFGGYHFVKQGVAEGSFDDLERQQIRNKIKTQVSPDYKKIARDREAAQLKQQSSGPAIPRKKGVAEGDETAADIDKKIEFHKQGQAAAQYKGAMNKMHAKKIRELQAKKEALKQGVAEDWQKVNKHDKTDGMSHKAVKAYRRENPGSKLQTAVTKKPSEIKSGSKDDKRRKSFCARMSGVKGPMKDEHGEPTAKAKALKRWNCREDVESNVSEDAGTIGLGLNDGTTKYIRSAGTSMDSIKSALQYLIRSRDIGTLRKLQTINGKDVSGIVSKILGTSDTINLESAKAKTNSDEKIGGRYTPNEWDEKIGRVKKLAGMGPMKTVYDPEKRVYRNVPDKNNDTE